ncbi:MAG: hypothetical protein MJZ86_01135 [Bacteroidales bacterium]|nr:hypothetical protein [Bacteroidales bacterium]
MIDNILLNASSNGIGPLGWIIIGGIAIGGAAYWAKKGEKDQGQTSSSNPEPDSKPHVLSDTPNQVEAKKTFLNNINVFIPLLRCTSDTRESKDAWTDAIIGTNDFNLISYWKLCSTKPFSTWRNVLASWGIKAETCTSFVYGDLLKGMYITHNKSDLIVGKEYIVVEPCWLQTYEDSKGKTVKRILLAGVVREK